MRYPSLSAALQKYRVNTARLPKGFLTKLDDACAFMMLMHRDQLKFGLYPYAIHPLSVFDFLVNVVGSRDLDLLLAGLLHDTVEDCDVDLSEIEEHFGPGVCRLVRAVSRRPPGAESEAVKARRKRRHFERYVLNASREVHLLGIADKYDNLRHMRVIPKSSPHYVKFPRWISEAEAFAELAAQTDPRAHRAFVIALNEQKRKMPHGRK